MFKAGRLRYGCRVRLRRTAAILVLLGLLTGLGDYPYVDEFFAVEQGCNVVKSPDGQDCSDHHRHATERMALCYTALASAVATSTYVVEIHPAHGPRIADEGMHPAISRAVDRIERPPAPSLAG